MTTNISKQKVIKKEKTFQSSHTYSDASEIVVSIKYHHSVF